VRVMLALDGETQHHLATFTRGDFFGEMAFLDKGVRSANAVADSPVEAYAMSRARFEAMAAEFPRPAQKVFARIARAIALRLRQADLELRTLREG